MHLLLFNGLHSANLHKLLIWDTQWGAYSEHALKNIHAHQDWVLVVEDMVLDDLDDAGEHGVVGVGTFSFSDTLLNVLGKLIE